MRRSCTEITEIHGNNRAEPRIITRPPAWIRCWSSVNSVTICGPLSRGFGGGRKPMIRKAESRVTAMAGPDHTQIRWLSALVLTSPTSGVEFGYEWLYQMMLGYWPSPSLSLTSRRAVVTATIAVRCPADGRAVGTVPNCDAAHRDAQVLPAASGGYRARAGPGFRAVLVPVPAASQPVDGPRGQSARRARLASPTRPDSHQVT